MKSVKIFGPAPDFRFDHSNEVSTGIIQTEGDMTFYLHNWDCKPISNKSTSKLFQRGN